MNPSLRDVATAAGVSPRTVSNVVSDFPHVAEDTRARVRAVIDELGYRPNAAARSLRRGRTGLVALVVPEADSPYFAELAALVSAAAEERGWTLLTDATAGDPERERRLLRGARAHLVDGLLLSPWRLSADDVRGRASGVPLVLLGEHDAGGADASVDRVVVDNVAAAREATAHLVALGRRRIAAVGAAAAGGADTARLRLRGYRQALREGGLAPDPALEVPVAALHRADGAAAVRALLDSGAAPDALFCANDQLALGALRAALERGLDVPGDLAVVGFDDIEDGRYATPSLTTVSPDKAALARLAVAHLADRLGAGAAGPARSTVVGHRLVVRESTAGRLTRG